MTSDDQHFLDVLAEYSNDVLKYTGSLWDASDRHFAWVASKLKKNIPQEWLPETARPRPPPPPPHRITGTYIHQLQDWVSQHRALTAAIFAFFGTGGYLIWKQRRRQTRKRRARRAGNGARMEVVVVAGPPNSPIVKSLSQDLERRGFIVYIVCADAEEKHQVLNEPRADVRPLHLNVADTLETEEAMDRFSNLLQQPHAVFAGATPHHLKFRGLILVPDLFYPSGPIETVSPELWSDALNAKVLNTIATTQAFLPTVCRFKSRVLLLTPSIVAALKPPFHSVEATVVSALDGFTASLRAELGTLGIDVAAIKLGTFDCSNVGGKQHLQSIGAPSTESWPPTARMSYASNYANQSRIARNRGLFPHSGDAGSPLRELHNAVFDALTQKHPKSTWRVGRGSVAYDLVGTWMPSGLVGWMLGVRRVSLDQESEPQLEESVYSWEKIETAV